MRSTAFGGVRAFPRRSRGVPEAFSTRSRGVRGRSRSVRASRRDYWRSRAFESNSEREKAFEVPNSYELWNAVRILAERVYQVNPKP